MSVRIIEAREEVGDVVSEIGEGPIWDDRFGVLRWVDIDRGLVHGWDPDRGPLPALDVGQNVGFVVPSGTDRLLAGLRDGFALLDLDGAIVEMLHAFDHDRPDMRVNDGKADPAGRVWAGTCNIACDEPVGTLYRLGSDGSAEPQMTDLTISNGLGWSPDGTRMYFTDTTWGRVDAFAYDTATGEWSDRRPFVEIPPEVGEPDGLTVDEDGCVWLAMWRGAAVHRYTPDGRLDTIVRVPALETTSCAFGGEDHRDLFITSATVGLTEQEWADHPRSGRVFTCRPGATGLRTDAFVPAS